MIVEGSVRLPFRYAAGAAGSLFLSALREEGRILGARCPLCERVLCPARSFCPRCGEGAAELVEVGQVGTLLSWTEVPAKGTYGLVRLDGADTALVHRVEGPAAALRVGARVRALLAADRTGSILDITGFALGEAAP